MCLRGFAKSENTRVKLQFGIGDTSDRFRLTESVAFIWKAQIFAGQTFRLQGCNEGFGLSGRHDLVVQALEENDGAGYAIGKINGRALPVNLRRLGIRPHQGIQVSRFEFVRIESERREIPNTVTTGAGGEYVMKNQRAQCRVPSSAASANRHPFGIDVAARRKVTRRLNAIFDVYNPPCPFQSVAIVAAIPGAAAVIDVDNRKAPARPELMRQPEARGCRSSRPTMTHHHGRRLFSV